MAHRFDSKVVVVTGGTSGTRSRVPLRRSAYHWRARARITRNISRPVLKADKKAIFTAASHAQKAADYLHGLQPQEAQS